MSEILDKVVATINDVCKPARPDLSNADKSIISDALDSLDFATVLMALEDEFGLSLQEVEIEKLNTVNKLVTYVAAHRKLDA